MGAPIAGWARAKRLELDAELIDLVKRKCAARWGFPETEAIRSITLRLTEERITSVSDEDARLSQYPDMNYIKEMDV